jgi:hypothetical protein
MEETTEVKSGIVASLTYAVAWVSVQLLCRIVIPGTLVLGSVAGLSHGYMWLEKLTIKEVNATYIKGIDYLVEKHGYVMEPYSEPESETREYYVHRIKVELEANGLSMAYLPVILALIEVESEWDVYSTSKSGAQGLMQIMPATAEKLGYQPKEMYVAKKNITAGVKWFGLMLKSQDYDLNMALKEYNAGAKRIDKTLENRQYAAKVFKAMSKLGEPIQ